MEPRIVLLAKTDIISNIWTIVGWDLYVGLAIFQLPLLCCLSLLDHAGHMNQRQRMQGLSNACSGSLLSKSGFLITANNLINRGVAWWASPWILPIHSSMFIELIIFIKLTFVVISVVTQCPIKLRVFLVVQMTSHLASLVQLVISNRYFCRSTDKTTIAMK